MTYPKTRLRRLRYNKKIRDLVQETRLNSNDLIYPIFVCDGENIKKEIKTLPGQYQLSIDNVLNLCDQIVKKRIGGIILFGIPSKKDDDGMVSHDDNGIVQRAIKEIKKKKYDILIIADLCHCQYTSHGHCGTIVDGDVDNDLTLKNLGIQALSLVKAGADVIAPSDMMDGRVGYIREVLDNDGHIKIPIFSYSVKYASSFYGPFREAAKIKSNFGDRKTHQMNYNNSDEALREVEMDIKEGVDVIIVKPAMSYLDIISRIKSSYNIPIIAYNVSGEYAMVKSASKNKLISSPDIIIEILSSMKRAGANSIITYHAIEIAELLN
ncbi:MAG: porphobilinogen synthase [Flavobacteriaceae bacterium]|nr:porphobilinogen synthase [Flavobacteriaceae bacterium]